MKNFVATIRNIWKTANGFDSLSRFLLKIGLIVIVLSFPLDKKIVYWIGVAILLFVYIRTFSKDKQKYNQQNSTFMKYKRKVTSFFQGQINAVKKFRNKLQQKKMYRFYKCPNCGQNIRIPKGKGKVTITCPSCSTKFVKKT